MQFAVTWFNSNKNIYDNYYLPADLIQLSKVRITNLYNYQDYLDTELSLLQVLNYKKGYGLVQDIFSNLTKQEINWIINLNKVNYIKHKSLVNKVEIYE